MTDITDDTRDPRIAHTRHRVQRAAIAELGAVGYGALTIEGVAARSGVAKSTIYRHWTGTGPLIADALDELNQQPVPTPDGGTVRVQVIALLTHLARAMSDPELSATVPALVDGAEHDPTIARLFHSYNDRRRRALAEAIATGIATGELDGALDPELTALALAGAIVYRRLMTDTPLPADHIEHLVDQVLGRPAEE